MFMIPYKFGVTACREVIEKSIGFWNILRPNKLLKFAVLVLFGDFPAEIWKQQKLHCYEIKGFAKKHFIKKNY